MKTRSSADTDTTDSSTAQSSKPARDAVDEQQRATMSSGSNALDGKPVDTAERTAATAYNPERVSDINTHTYERICGKVSGGNMV